MTWNVLLSGMRETPYLDEGAELMAIESTGLVRAIADALCEHWPDRIDVDEKMRALPRKEATLLRCGRNAGGVGVLSAASVEVTTHQGRAAYSLRGYRRKLYYVDDVIIDVLPGWDREADFTAAIREHAMALMPEGVQEVGDGAYLRSPGSVIWGTVRLRDGAERPGASWRIEEFDAGFDTVRGQYVTPSSPQPKPLSARGADLIAWSVGVVPPGATE